MHRGARAHELGWVARLVAPPVVDHLGVARVVSGAEREVLDAVGASLDLAHRVLGEPDRVPFAELDDLVLDLDPRRAAKYAGVGCTVTNRHYRTVSRVKDTRSGGSAHPTRVSGGRRIRRDSLQRRRTYPWMSQPVDVGSGRCPRGSAGSSPVSRTTSVAPCV